METASDLVSPAEPFTMITPGSDDQGCVLNEAAQPSVIGGAYRIRRLFQIPRIRRPPGEQVARHRPTEAPVPGECHAADQRGIIDIRISSGRIEADKYRPG